MPESWRERKWPAQPLADSQEADSQEAYSKQRRAYSQ